MPIVVKHSPSFAAMGAPAYAYGQRQAYLQDAELSLRTQQLAAQQNAQMQQAKIAEAKLQLDAQDSLRDDQLKYMGMGMDYEKMLRGEALDYNKLGMQNQQFTQQLGQQRDLHTMDDQRMREMQQAGFGQEQGMADFRHQSSSILQQQGDTNQMDRMRYQIEQQREMEQQMEQMRQSGRMDLQNQQFGQQRERDLMGYRAQQGMSPVPWGPQDEQQLSSLQRSYQAIQTDPTYSPADRQQATQLINQRMQPLMQRQQEAQQFSQQNRTQQFNQDIQMRTVPYRNPYTGVTEHYFFDQGGRPHRLSESPSGGGSSSSTNREIVPGLTQANLDSMLSDIRRETDENGMPRFSTPAAQQEEVMRRVQSRQQIQRQLTGGEAPTMQATTRIIQGELNRLQQIRTMRGPEFEAYIRQLGQGDVQRGLLEMGTPDRLFQRIQQQQDDVAQLTEFARITNGFTTQAGMTLQQREQMAEVYQRIRQTNPAFAQQLGRAMMGGQAQQQQPPQQQIMPQAEPAPQAMPQQQPAQQQAAPREDVLRAAAEQRYGRRLTDAEWEHLRRIMMGGPR